MMLVFVPVFVVMMVMVMMFFVLRLFREFFQRFGKRILLFHSGKNRRAFQLRPGSRNDGRIRIVLFQKLHDICKLLFGNIVRPAQNDTTRGFDLVVVKLSEISDIRLRFFRVHHGRHGIDDEILRSGRLYGKRHIGQFSDSGRLDQDPVRRIGVDHHLQRFPEIADKRAADASGIQFRYFDACVLHERSVNTDFAEFVFDQHQLLTPKSLLDQLADQRCFSRAEKARKYINFYHYYVLQ